jgi:hypothetical protein
MIFFVKDEIKTREDEDGNTWVLASPIAKAIDVSVLPQLIEVAECAKYICDMEEDLELEDAPVKPYFPGMADLKTALEELEKDD